MEGYTSTTSTAEFEILMILTLFAIHDSLVPIMEVVREQNVVTIPSTYENQARS